MRTKLVWTTATGNVWTTTKLNGNTMRLNRIGYLPEDGGFIKQEGIPAIVSTDWFSSAVQSRCLVPMTLWGKL